MASRPGMSWYVVHTYSGFENKAKQALEQRIQMLGVQEKFGEVLVPTEQAVEVRGGEKRQVTRKFFPGYILVQMSLDNETWHVVKQTPKITGFVGGARNPPAVPEDQIRRAAQILEAEEVAPQASVEFERGEDVRVVGGPFVNLRATIEEVDISRGKLRATAQIFGRPTPIVLDFTEVEKL